MAVHKKIDLEEISSVLFADIFGGSENTDLEELASNRKVNFYYSTQKSQDSDTVVIKPNMTIGESRIALANGIVRSELSRNDFAKKFSLSEEDCSEVSRKITLRLLFDEKELEQFGSAKGRERTFRKHRRVLPHHFVKNAHKAKK